MAMDTNIIGAVSGTGADVNASRQLKITAETDVTTNPGNVGAFRFFSENDPGEITGEPYLKSPETSSDYRLRVGMDTIILDDTFNGLIQNTTKWFYSNSTMTAAMPGAGTLNFGVVQGTAAGHGAFMRSFQYMPLFGASGLAIEFHVGQFTSTLIANEVFRGGLGNVTTAGVAPTDGCWLEYSAAGLVLALSYNGVITQSGILESNAAMALGRLYHYAIVLGNSEVEVWKEDVLLGKMAIPAATSQPFLQGALPFFVQKACTGTVSNTNTMRVSDITISQIDILTNKDWGVARSLAGKSGFVGQNGHTQGKTALWGNNTAPTAVSLTNTTAAFTGLGGIAAVLPTLAANSDGILFSYQNPAPTINITGRNLVITGVEVKGAVSVILAGGPVIYAFAVAFGHTAVSLATTESASFASNTTHAPRIAVLGIESYPATAAVGTSGAGARIALANPIVVRPGEFVAILARNIGTVTTTGAITFTASFDAYWE
jgi:hypothetical protein